MKKRIMFIVVIIVTLLMVFLFWACSTKNEPVQQNNKASNERENGFSVSVVNAKYDDAEHKKVLFTFVYTQEMFDFEIGVGKTGMTEQGIRLTCLINDSEQRNLGGVNEFFGIKYESQDSRGGNEYVLALKPKENVYFYMILNNGKNKLVFDLLYTDGGLEKKRQTSTIEIEI